MLAHVQRAELETPERHHVEPVGGQSGQKYKKTAQ
jgi:hypothetical protein